MIHFQSITIEWNGFDMFMGAKTIWLQQIMSIDKGEALELLAMEWVRELEFKKLLFA